MAHSRMVSHHDITRLEGWAQRQTHRLTSPPPPAAFLLETWLKSVRKRIALALGQTREIDEVVLQGQFMLGL